MKARPILFSGEMVRALLDGRKTQTRRVVKSPAKNMQARGAEVITHREPGDKWYGDHVWSMRGDTGVWADYTHEKFLSMCPFGPPGDMLWVRETHFVDPGDPSEEVVYRADPLPCWEGEEQEIRWKPSIFMPRRFSRLTLRITDVRVERLQDISEEDAKAEGVAGEEQAADAGLDWYDKPRRAFRFLWQRINGPDSWDSNPWVWVVSFEVIKANIDDVLKQEATAA